MCNKFTLIREVEIFIEKNTLYTNKILQRRNANSRLPDEKMPNLSKIKRKLK